MTVFVIFSVQFLNSRSTLSSEFSFLVLRFRCTMFRWNKLASAGILYFHGFGLLKAGAEWNFPNEGWRCKKGDGGWRQGWEKMGEEGKMGLFVRRGGASPCFIHHCLRKQNPHKKLPSNFFRVVILICGQNSHQTLSRYQSPPRFQSGQDYQPDMCSPVWRFEFNWWRWASDWPKIRCTNCVERIFRRGKNCKNWHICVSGHWQARQPQQ